MKCLSCNQHKKRNPSYGTDHVEHRCRLTPLVTQYLAQRDQTDDDVIESAVRDSRGFRNWILRAQQQLLRDVK